MTAGPTGSPTSDSSSGTEESDVFRDKRRDDADDLDGDAVPAENPEIAKLAADLAERTADLQRVTAEYANYRKRVDRDRELAAVTAKASLASDLLGVLDDLELAQRHGDLTGAFKSVAERLTSTLEKAGLQGFGAEGDAFDPAHHEAVQFGTSADVATPTVTSVFRRGYSFKDRPLRAAVVVVTGPDHDAVHDPTNGESVNTPEADAADLADRADDAKARAEQESKTGVVPDLSSDTDTVDGQPRPAEDPA